MTYTESAALMTDLDFRNRIKVACLKFAEYIMDEAANVPAHNTRLRWAGGCIQNPDMAAVQTQSPTVMDSAVQAQGAAISDVDLQTAVETTLNTKIL